MLYLYRGRREKSAGYHRGNRLLGAKTPRKAVLTVHLFVVVQYPSICLAMPEDQGLLLILLVRCNHELLQMSFQGAGINLAFNDLYEERCELFTIWHYKVISMVLKEVSSGCKPGPFVPLQVCMRLCDGDHALAQPVRIDFALCHGPDTTKTGRSVLLQSFRL